MKIELRGGEVQFDSLTTGDTFEHQGDLYQKMREIIDKYKRHNAVRLVDGYPQGFTDCAPVRPVQGTFKED